MSRDERYPGVSRQSLFARAAPLHTGRAGRLLWLMVLLVASFAAWANWAKLDVQVRAPGEIIVSSRSQVVQAVDGGVLSRLLVREGQWVRAGEVIAELDTARFAARAAEAAAEVRSLRANSIRLEAELADAPLEFGSKFNAYPELVRSQQNLYDARREQQGAQAESLRRSLALARKSLAAVESLARTGDAAQAEVLKARQSVNELNGKLVNGRNEYRRKAQGELSDTRSKLEQAVQVLKQHRDALKATRIHAPMAGTVKEIKVSTIGAVLAPGDEILQIVPADDPLLVEARVNSADVAFLRPGLEANAKLTAYDFTVYGALHGEVTYISPDTIDEDLQRNEEPYYRVLIRITEIPARSGRGSIEIIPGMVASVEIITGNRTVAQYLLTPLLRGGTVALTER